ncbi:phosphodiester glycosidase family protein [Streptomyces sp. NPDC101158]|uniref:phosphodiester glycosidase family protein n=1 Tax=Streptomyces sp. NPDC101158 TaxID=3366117 RepID=UPI0037F83B00
MAALPAGEGTLPAGEGARDAFSLGGGGSSTLVGRAPGETSVTVRNHPGAGAERPLPNGMGVLGRWRLPRTRGRTPCVTERGGPEVASVACRQGRHRSEASHRHGLTTSGHAGLDRRDVHRPRGCEVVLRRRAGLDLR